MTMAKSGLPCPDAHVGPPATDLADKLSQLNSENCALWSSPTWFGSRMLYLSEMNSRGQRHAHGCAQASPVWTPRKEAVKYVSYHT